MRWQCPEDAPMQCEGGRKASVDSIAACVSCFVRQHRPQQKDVRSLAVALKAAVQKSDRKEHMWLEFGAFAGTTAKMLREASAAWGRVDGIHSFDAFLGLPEDWRTKPGTYPAGEGLRPLRAGSFSLHGRPPFLASGIDWVIGWFNETLPHFLEKWHAPVSLLHVDCDLYSSTNTVLRLLEPRLRAGTIIVFDELLNYPGWQEHEALAFVELLRRTGFGYRVLAASAKTVVTRDGKLRAAMAPGRAPQRSGWGEDVAIELLDATPSPPAPSLGLPRSDKRHPARPDPKHDPPSRSEASVARTSTSDLRRSPWTSTARNGQPLCTSAALVTHPTLRGFRVTMRQPDWRPRSVVHVELDGSGHELASHWGPVTRMPSCCEGSVVRFTLRASPGLAMPEAANASLAHGAVHANSKLPHHPHRLASDAASHRHEVKAHSIQWGFVLRSSYCGEAPRVLTTDCERGGAQRNASQVESRARGASPRGQTSDWPRECAAQQQRQPRPPPLPPPSPRLRAAGPGIEPGYDPSEASTVPAVAAHPHAHPPSDRSSSSVGKRHRASAVSHQPNRERGVSPTSLALPPPMKFTPEREHNAWRRWGSLSGAELAAVRSRCHKHAAARKHALGSSSEGGVPSCHGTAAAAGRAAASDDGQDGRRLRQHGSHHGSHLMRPSSPAVTDHTPTLGGLSAAEAKSKPLPALKLVINSNPFCEWLCTPALSAMTMAALCLSPSWHALASLSISCNLVRAACACSRGAASPFDVGRPGTASSALRLSSRSRI